jgi:hypothetical protein
MSVGRTFGSICFPHFARASGPPTQVLIDSSVVKTHRSATIWRRPHDQNPRFNRTYSRTSSLLLTGGEVADCKLGEQLLARLPACEILHRNKGYDSSAIRRQVQDCDAMPNIPPKGKLEVEELLLAISLPQPQRAWAPHLREEGNSSSNNITTDSILHPTGRKCDRTPRRHKIENSP